MVVCGRFLGRVDRIQLVLGNAVRVTLRRNHESPDPVPDHVTRRLWPHSEGPDRPEGSGAAAAGFQHLWIQATCQLQQRAWPEDVDV